MGRKTWYLLAVAGAALISLQWSRSAPLQNQAAPSAALTSFKITFGDRQEVASDYSGGVSLSSGKVVRITPWRFLRDASVSGSNWKQKLTRMLFENQPDLPRPSPSPGQTLNIVPAGVFVTGDAPASAAVQMKTAQGNFDFRLADLGDGRVLSFRDGDVLIQRAPTAEPISTA